MYRGEHAPPHFHVVVAGERASYRIDTLERIVGRLPGRAERLVLRWARVRQAELFENWSLAQAHRSPKRINPLD